MQNLLALGVLLAVIAVVYVRLPRVELGHSAAFLRRRFINWFPLGLTYALLYFGRYNLAAVKDVKALSEHDYGSIVGVASFVYGCAFLLNGPLVDRFGGRFGILMAAGGAAITNALMGGIALLSESRAVSVNALTVLYALNMYFQSFGAVAIVKVNSGWFHVRERGAFGGIFGILISLGLFFAFDWGLKIAKLDTPSPIHLVFLIPAATLAVFFAICWVCVANNPSDTGHADFDTADASSGDDGPRLPVFVVARRMFSNPVIVTIAVIEFCSGFLRNAIMHWYRDFALAMAGGDSAIAKQQFVYANWGLLLCVAGILGGTFAGLISDRIFSSRRGPVSAVLYGIMVLGALAIMPILSLGPAVGWVVVFMSMAVIGVHGMLSGTASQDFGGKKNAGVAVGLIDGCVYLGTGLQSVLLGSILPAKGTEAAKVVENWRVWPVAMLPIALLGFFLSLRVWNARPQGKAPAPKPAPEAVPASSPAPPVPASEPAPTEVAAS